MIPARFVLAFVMLFAVLPAAQAQAPDPAAQQIQSFYNMLVAAMKQGGSVKGRYDKLKPAVEAAYDLPGMTALSVGPSWATIPPDGQKALIAAFSRMTVASYAQSFDSFHGEKFTVDPAVVTRGAERFVKTQMVPPQGQPIAFNYRMHEADGTWRILDVYLAGNISQLAQKRSDFSGTLASGGAKALVQKIDALSDRLLGP